jgi:hypothetical protein
MTRPWGKLYAAMLNHRKFLRSTPEERGAWVTLFLYALNSTTDEDLGTADDVTAMLRREGFADPQASLTRLVELGWIDQEGTRHLLHDWHDWQPDDPTGAKRKRALHDLLRGSGTSADRHETVRGMSADVPRTGSGRSRPRGDGDRDSSPVSPSTISQRTAAAPAYGRANLDDLLERDPPGPLPTSTSLDGRRPVSHASPTGGAAPGSDGQAT